jgi:hypothetical protein
MSIPVALGLLHILCAALFRTDNIHVCNNPSTTALTVDCLIQDGQWAQNLDDSLISHYRFTIMASLLMASLSIEVRLLCGKPNTTSEFPLYPVKRARNTKPTEDRFSVTGLTIVRSSKLPLYTSNIFYWYLYSFTQTNNDTNCSLPPLFTHHKTITTDDCLCALFIPFYHVTLWAD